MVLWKYIPDSVLELNKQREFNIHNLGFVHSIKYRALNLFILSVGVLFPMLAITNWGRKISQKLVFPVLPAGYVAFFIGSYLFGKILYGYAGTMDAATEVRELLLALGITCFAIHGAIRSEDLFRINRIE